MKIDFNNIEYSDAKENYEYVNGNTRQILQIRGDRETGFDRFSLNNEWVDLVNVDLSKVAKGFEDIVKNSEYIPSIFDDEYIPSIFDDEFDDPDEGVDPDTLWQDYTDDITDDQEDDTTPLTDSKAESEAPVTTPVKETVKPDDTPKTDSEPVEESKQGKDNDKTGKKRGRSKGEIKITGYTSHYYKYDDAQKTIDEIKRVCNEAIEQVQKLSTQLLDDMSKLSDDEMKEINKALSIIRKNRRDKAKSKTSKK